MPNLLYIHSDQHCPLVTGCYGDRVVETPNLDRLAASGVVMDSAYCPSPICGPSRMSMLTGRHPYQNRSWTNRDILDSQIPSLAHAMGAAGYRPVLAGRMHSIGPDQLRGYSQRLVGDHSPNFPGGGPAPDRGALNGTAGPALVSLQASGAGQSGYEVHDEDVTDAAVAYLSQLGDAEQPFSLTVGLMLPHPPYVARRPDYERYAGNVPPPRNPTFTEESPPEFLRWWRKNGGLDVVSDEAKQRSRIAYWGLVASMDRMIGRILDALEQTGQAEDTLVVYTSDHGDMLGEHGLFWKHTFYEESVRVPLLLSWPGVIPAGKRNANVVSALDVTATILDAVQAPPLPGSPGRSLLPLARGDAGAVDAWEDVAFSEYCSDESGWSPPGGCYQRMIRAGDWKLIYYHDEGLQLFNLREDPGELANRADAPDCRQVRDDLQARLLADWHPEQVIADMAARREQNAILAAWAENTQPANQHLWDLQSKMFYLEDPQQGRAGPTTGS